MTSRSSEPLASGLRATQKDAVRQPNRDLLARAIRIYELAVRSYIVGRFREREGAVYVQVFASRFPEHFAAREPVEEDDVLAFLEASTFRKVLKRLAKYFPELVYPASRIARNGGKALHWIEGLRTWRNVVSHPPARDLRAEDVARQLDAIRRILALIDATEALAEVGKLRDTIGTSKRSSALFARVLTVPGWISGPLGRRRKLARNLHDVPGGQDAIEAVGLEKEDRDTGEAHGQARDRRVAGTGVGKSEPPERKTGNEDQRFLQKRGGLRATGRKDRTTPSSRRQVAEKQVQEVLAVGTDKAALARLGCQPGAAGEFPAPRHGSPGRSARVCGSVH